MTKFFTGLLATLIAIFFIGCGSENKGGDFVSPATIVESNNSSKQFKGANISKTKNSAIISFSDTTQNKTEKLTLTEESVLSAIIWSKSSEYVYVVDKDNNYLETYEELIVGEEYKITVSSYTSEFYSKVLYGENYFTFTNNNDFVKVNMSLSEKLQFRVNVKIDEEVISVGDNIEFSQENGVLSFLLNVEDEVKVLTNFDEYVLKLTPSLLIDAIKRDGFVKFEETGTLDSYMYGVNNYNVSEKDYFSSSYQEELDEEIVYLTIFIDKPIRIYYFYDKGSDSSVKVYHSDYSQKKWENGMWLEVGDYVELSYSNTINLDFELYFDDIDLFDLLEEELPKV